MEEHSISNTLAIKFLCFMSIIFILLNILELEKIYLNWIESISTHKNNIDFIDECIKYPLLLKTFFSLFSLFFSISAAIFTLLVSINIQFFIDKCLLTYIYYNFYLFGPYLLISSFFAIMNFDKVFHNCKKIGIHSDDFLKVIKATSFIEKQNITDFFPNDFSDNVIRGERIFHNNNNYASVSNIFNLVTTITFSFLLTLTMTLYETYGTYHCSILRKDGGNPIIGKLFWVLVSKNRVNRILRRDPVNNNLITNDTNNNSEVANNSRDLINNTNLNEETSLLVRNQDNSNVLY